MSPGNASRAAGDAPSFSSAAGAPADFLVPRLLPFLAMMPMLLAHNVRREVPSAAAGCSSHSHRGESSRAGPSLCHKSHSLKNAGRPHAPPTII